MDLTGKGSSVVFLGAYFGWLTAPPLAGLVYNSTLGPMAIFYSTLVIALMHLLLFTIMIKLGSKMEIKY